MDAFVLLFTLAILLALGMPVAFAVGLSAVAGALWIDLPLEALMIQITSGVNKFTLLAIPFFILAGAIMAEGGIARRLVNFAYVFVGFIRGGLSLVNIVASTFFGAISGSSVADTASIGSVMIPEMEKKGTLASPATALASRVLPVPGGPTSSTPLGMRAPSELNFDGFLRNSTISTSSSFSSSAPATSLNVTFGISSGCLGFALPKPITPLVPPPRACFIIMK